MWLLNHHPPLPPRRKRVQHPCVSVAVGHLPLQPPHLLRQAHQRHDDQNGQTYRRQRQDLPAVPPRVETRRSKILYALEKCNICGIALLSIYAHCFVIANIFALTNVYIYFLCSLILTSIFF